MDDRRDRSSSKVKAKNRNEFNRRLHGYNRLRLSTPEVLPRKDSYVHPPITPSKSVKSAESAVSLPEPRLNHFSYTATTVASVRVFFLLPVKWQISERSGKGGQVKSWRLILNSVFCFLNSALGCGSSSRASSSSRVISCGPAGSEIRPYLSRHL